jgi:hypothetical protein
LLETNVRRRKQVVQVVMTNRKQKEGRWMKLTPFRPTYLLQYRIWLTRQLAEHEKTYCALFSTVKTVYRAQLVTSGNVVKHDSSCIRADSAALFGTDGKIVKLF